MRGDLVCTNTLNYLQNLGYNPSYLRGDHRWVEITDQHHALSLAVRVFVFPSDSWIYKPKVLADNERIFLSFCRRHLCAKDVTDEGKAFLALAEIWAHSENSRNEVHLEAMINYLKEEEQIHRQQIRTVRIS